MNIGEERSPWVVGLAMGFAGIHVIQPVIEAIVEVAICAKVINVVFGATGGCD